LPINTPWHLLIGLKLTSRTATAKVMLSENNSPACLRAATPKSDYIKIGTIYGCTYIDAG